MNVYDEPTEVRVNLTRPLSGPHHWVLDLPSRSVIVHERRWATGTHRSALRRVPIRSHSHTSVAW